MGTSERRVALLFGQHTVFIRRAREAAQNTLYFLGFLERTNIPRVDAALLKQTSFALEQIVAMISSVPLLAKEAPLEFSQLPNLEERRKVRRAQLLERWWEVRVSALVAKLSQLDPGDALGELPTLEKQLKRFLRVTMPQSGMERYLPQVLSIFRYLGKNTAFVLSGLLAVSVALRVDIISSLIFNEGIWIAIPSLLLVIPFAALIKYARWRRERYGYVPLYHLGGVAFHRRRFQPLAPHWEIRRWNRSSKFKTYILYGLAAKLAIYVVWYALVAVLYVYVLSGIIGPASLTVFSLVALVGLIMLACYAADYLGYIERGPVRLLIALVITLFGPLLVGYNRLGIAGAGVTIGVALVLGCWFLLSSFEGSKIRFPMPVSKQSRVILGSLCLLVAISAGIASMTYRRSVWSGSMAATAPLNRFTLSWPYSVGGDNQPPVVVIAASGGGSRAALYAALVLQKLGDEFPQIASNIQAISSVSGGSLASAVYIARRLSSRERGLNCSVDASCLKDIDRAVSQDFIRPTIIGSVLPTISRADAVERVWSSDPVGLGSYRLSDVIHAWKEARARGDPTPPVPVPLFNATSLDGHYVVLSPLQKELYTSKAQRASEAYDRLVDPTWVFDRDAIYGLEDLLPDFDPTISSAVRASASFPFGFPSVDIRTRQRLRYSPLPKFRDSTVAKIVSLTDGGALSNSGMWPVYHLLRNAAPQLRDRGVLLLVVDASRMPSPPGFSTKVLGLASTILDKSPGGQFLHRELYQSLLRLYGDQIAIVQVDLVPTKKYNVLTTWALDQRSLERVRESFDRRWNEERCILAVAWRRVGGSLVECQSPTRSTLHVLSRPPLN